MCRFFLSLSVHLVFVGMCFAQKDSVPAVEKITYDQQSISPLEFDDESIASYKNKKAFDYERAQQENWWSLFKKWMAGQWDRFWNWLLGSYTANGIFAFLIKILPYLVIAAILGFIVWLFIKLNPAASVLEQQQRGRVMLSEDEKIIQHEDISALIEKAKQQNNHRLAIRYYYLLVLKKMRDLELIDYQFQKTNEEYLTEISSIRLKEQFKNITHIYDFIWYGDFPLTEMGFKKAENDFVGMRAALNKHSDGEAL